MHKKLARLSSELAQGTLTEGELSVRLTSTLRKLVLLKRKNKFLELKKELI
jgi:hypothetical protein